jgi:hypothetical protein
MQDQRCDDKAAILDIVARQFRSLSWEPGRPADLSAFAADFFDGTRLYPAARPVQAVAVPDFARRMAGLAATTLARFDEAVAGAPIIHVFGGVAVAVCVCEIAEKGGAARHNMEMMLLVKTQSGWRIAAQAWDQPVAPELIPEDLRGAPSQSS